MEAVPDSSTMDLPLGKAEPLDGGCSVSGIMYLRRGKNPGKPCEPARTNTGAACA